eukprot:CAMPEP_0113832244 /NCGR_PEP_ID=MMETSP0328-20130328/7277_1 /TAXON_ID=39455 /ORGANISM="Alexandrium minutum" /LENGTH=53 /DNA_ID=CAMNT_0000800447 /DNA_START=169 /DNA_END=327 /DNA_ORIENTATION=- /assembly_acc=CAM_ASM_000350
MNERNYQFVRVWYNALDPANQRDEAKSLVKAAKKKAKKQKEKMENDESCDQCC